MKEKKTRESKKEKSGTNTDMERVTRKITKRPDPDLNTAEDNEVPQTRRFEGMNSDEEARSPDARIRDDDIEEWADNGGPESQVDQEAIIHDDTEPENNEEQKDGRRHEDDKSSDISEKSNNDAINPKQVDGRRRDYEPYYPTPSKHLRGEDSEGRKRKKAENAKQFAYITRELKKPVKDYNMSRWPIAHPMSMGHKGWPRDGSWMQNRINSAVHHITTTAKDLRNYKPRDDRLDYIESWIVSTVAFEPRDVKENKRMLFALFDLLKALRANESELRFKGGAVEVGKWWTCTDNANWLCEGHWTLIQNQMEAHLDMLTNADPIWFREVRLSEALKRAEAREPHPHTNRYFLSLLSTALILVTDTCKKAEERVRALRAEVIRYNGVDLEGSKKIRDFIWEDRRRKEAVERAFPGQDDSSEYTSPSNKEGGQDRNVYGRGRTVSQQEEFCESLRYQKEKRKKELAEREREADISTYTNPSPPTNQHRNDQGRERAGSRDNTRQGRDTHGEDGQGRGRQGYSDESRPRLDPAAGWTTMNGRAKERTLAGSAPQRPLLGSGPGSYSEKVRGQTREGGDTRSESPDRLRGPLFSAPARTATQTLVQGGTTMFVLDNLSDKKQVEKWCKVVGTLNVEDPLTSVEQWISKDCGAMLKRLERLCDAYHGALALSIGEFIELMDREIVNPREDKWSKSIKELFRSKKCHFELKGLDVIKLLEALKPLYDTINVYAEAIAEAETKTATWKELSQVLCSILQWGKMRTSHDDSEQGQTGHVRRAAVDEVRTQIRDNTITTASGLLDAFVSTIMATLNHFKAFEEPLSELARAEGSKGQRQDRTSSSRPPEKRQRTEGADIKPCPHCDKTHRGPCWYHPSGAGKSANPIRQQFSGTEVLGQSLGLKLNAAVNKVAAEKKTAAAAASGSPSRGAPKGKGSDSTSKYGPPKPKTSGTPNALRALLQQDEMKAALATVDVTKLDPQVRRQLKRIRQKENQKKGKEDPDK